MYKHMLIDANLKPRKRGVKNRAVWKKSNNWTEVPSKSKKRRILGAALPKESPTSRHVSAVSAKRLS